MTLLYILTGLGALFLFLNLCMLAAIAKNLDFLRKAYMLVNSAPEVDGADNLGQRGRR